ncbi:hypothetical protein OG259_41090 [Streptomyces sp. NBC_00250]|uniref:hypothetical protein n=1 Tax=Streptomyces sp. NBC_00250 TaxID=2903641 RepID=UPI002E27B8E1|nr:hypothetical protein [Streptomyces sp. NBC_00250]
MAALVTTGLLVVVIAVDLDTGDRIASIIGAVLACAGLVIAVASLNRRDTPSAGYSVQAGTGGIAVGGNITGSALGSNSRVSAQPPPASTAAPADGAVAPTPSVTAEPGGIAAGGDITGSALGEGSQVQ